jgi:hypothetical protein
MTVSIDEAIANCLEQINNQGSSIEDCTARYPQYENELVELLGLVYSIKNLDQISPRTLFVENASQRLVSKLPNRNVSYREKTRPIKRKRQRQKLRLSFGVVRMVTIIVIVLTVFTGGTAFAADSAEPGDYLYGLDLTLEQIQLSLAPTQEAAARIHLNIANERLEEAENKLGEGDYDNGNVALDAYEQEMATLAGLVSGENGVDKEELTELVIAETSRHQEVLEQLLGKVPEPAQKGILRAIEASNKAKDHAPKGPPEDRPVGPPEDKTTGPPEDKETGKSKEKDKNKSNSAKSPPGKP